ncbi:type VI secretion system tip protein TssI/VgrG [Simiduia curdlanivorans]|uniref:Type VI secretion system Vgr family protein n=1 Tax=Simiduia curdlanivorans TaxID=1492769 RepID=A0ABV8V6E2_9GAMM|nr:type VI secretion system tip protein TssI/VgrG [Simiduia curdlanivorans]MDN3640232.1 type VI secretion system tip protein TssI/VgrG [Simiduia curdlanivorans]
MASINQKHRLLHINTALGKDHFIATRLAGDESVSKLFRYEVDLLSTNHEVTQKDLVGKPATVTINRDGKEELRHIHGYVSQLSLFDVNAEGLRAYRAVIVPGLWFAQLSSNNRVFHRKTAKAIIEEVLGEYSKVVKLSLKLNASYKTREYCVQFEETDLAFACRLMAEEGIAYYFIHGDGKLELVLTDDAQGFFDCSAEPIEYDGGGSHPTKSTVHAWSRSFCFHTGGVEHKDYSEFSSDKDHKQEVKTKTSLNDASAYKIRDFGKYLLEPDKDQTHKITDASNKDIATRMMETIESGFDVANASSDCASLTAGGRFQLDHTLATEKGKYLVTRVQMSAADGNGSDTHFTNQFIAVPAAVIPRPDPTAFARRVSHAQLAKVLEVKATTADGSDDIYTQVKVKFPWNTAQNSCWVRVQQVFAGKNWGANFVPRVGQEVVVSYINGDPDRPIVTGAVYNNQNGGPNYTATQSGWKTEFEGSKFNEFRFDDKKGSEEIYLEAGKDHNYLIHNDETGKIENNQTLEVVKDRTIDVTEGNETKTIGKGDQSITVKSGNQTVKVSKGTQTVDVQGAIKITSKTSIELKVGGSSIKMTPAGITIKGTTLSCKGDATAEVKAGASLTLKGGITLIN